MIDGILIVLSVLSAAYFLVISIYSGIGTSFSFIWLFFCALFLFLSYGRWYYARNIDRIPRWVPVSVGSPVYVLDAKKTYSIPLLFLV